jgi:hypothetical protein
VGLFGREGKMKDRQERIVRIAAGVADKIRKTVPMNTGTRVERDKSKYDKGKRKQWKHDLRRMEGSREELAMELVRKGYSIQEAVLVAANM